MTVLDNEFPAVMTAKQVMEYLRISRKTLYRWQREEGLPVVKISDKASRYRREAIDEWLAGRESNRSTTT